MPPPRSKDRPNMSTLLRHARSTPLRHAPSTPLRHAGFRERGFWLKVRRAQTCVDSPCHASDAEVRTLRGRSARGGPRDRGGGASGVQKQDLGSGQFLNGGGLGSGVQKCNGSGFRSDSCKSGSCVFQPVLELRAVSAISISQLRTVIRFRKGARFRGCRCFSKPRFQVLIPNLQPHPEFQTQLPQKKKTGCNCNHESVPAPHFNNTTGSKTSPIFNKARLD